MQLFMLKWLVDNFFSLQTKLQTDELQCNGNSKKYD
ncbi:hypothetical protein J2S05_002199 [Alkalicoccobacillus murimartini]|uniref:Uncharacterized protein n=1 Tax=Alkalicoccobacillus murimartini TaxID=171685 RepID=A0ABT9YHQ3_9BACI|nr:hypothetical protein [Alkalicoccobacillus murimartini]